jgi:hypothetical protein
MANPNSWIFVEPKSGCTGKYTKDVALKTILSFIV